jgi:CubicO group peptidase (beta-lactamase class C family)
MPSPIDSIGDYIQDAMDSWHIPGTAVAIVQGDEVLHRAGYGLRNVEQALPVTPSTRFAIASMTKAFTAMGVAVLVDDGLADWDKPVREYLPSFKLKDAYASENITLRDMLSHRSGLPRHDLSWYGAAFTREQLVHNVRHHAPNKTFRSAWEYQNLMYVTAGYVSGLLGGGVTWEEHIQKRIFDPLSMSSSTFDAAGMQQSTDYSLAYRLRREGATRTLETMPFYHNSVMGPAGSIHSNLNDLVRWLKVHLNGGRSEDVQLVSPGNLAQMHRPNMIMPVDGLTEKMIGTTVRAYGLGWFIVPYKGHTLIEHGGNIDGFSLNISFIPQINAGAVVLTNCDGKPLRDVLMHEIADRLLGITGGDWNSKYHAIWAETEKGQDQSRSSSADERHPNATPSHPLTDYVGTFTAEGYADFEVKLENDQLRAWFGGQWWPLNHYHYDIFEMDMSRFELYMKVSFHTDTRGSISSLSVPVEPEVQDIHFSRQPVSITPETTATLLAVYDLPFDGMVLTILQKGDGKLYAQVTGQSDVELIPYRAQSEHIEYTLKDQPNVALSFQREEGAWVALLKQFGVVFRAPRLPG